MHKLGEVKRTVVETARLQWQYPFLAFVTVNPFPLSIQFTVMEVVPKLQTMEWGVWKWEVGDATLC